MKKKSSSDPDRDTMRSEYDFSKGVRGLTAKRCEAGTNLALIDPDVMDVFPDSETINQTLRALAPVLRRQRDSTKKKKGA